jgi:hypothetical protein
MGFVVFGTGIRERNNGHDPNDNEQDNDHTKDNGHQS